MLRKLPKLTFLASMLFTLQAQAAVVNQITEVGNMIFNDEATTAGLTQSGATVRFYSGSSVLCDTKTVPFGSYVVVQPGVTTGTGTTTCTAAITSITATPITANATVGAVYGTSAITYSVTSTDTIIQLLLVQKAATTSGGVTTHYAPVFDSTNGTVGTPGVPVFLSQSHFKMPYPYSNGYAK